MRVYSKQTQGTKWTLSATHGVARHVACTCSHMSGEGALHLWGDRKNLLGIREHIYSRACLLGSAVSRCSQAIVSATAPMLEMFPESKINQGFAGCWLGL